jgi:hypothetical protein
MLESRVEQLEQQLLHLSAVHASGSGSSAAAAAPALSSGNVEQLTAVLSEMLEQLKKKA